MRTSFSFQESLLHDRIYDFVDLRSIYDMLNPGAFIGDSSKTKLLGVMPWYADNAVVSDDRDAVIYPEFFATALAVTAVNEYSNATEVDTSFKDEFSRVIKKHFRDDAQQIREAGDYLLAAFLQDNFIAVEELKKFSWHRLTGMMSTGNEVWLTFDEHDQRAVAYDIMEDRKARYGRSDFVPVVKEVFDFKRAFGWARDMEAVRRNRETTRTHRAYRTR